VKPRRKEIKRRAKLLKMKIANGALLELCVCCDAVNDVGFAVKALNDRLDSEYLHVLSSDHDLKYSPQLPKQRHCQKEAKEKALITEKGQKECWRIILIVGRKLLRFLYICLRREAVSIPVCNPQEPFQNASFVELMSYYNFLRRHPEFA
jgi:hypothetical protein